jgi:hypothetical protein
MDGFLPGDDETVRRLGASQDLLFEDLVTHTPPAPRALSWQAQCELYPQVIDRLEAAEGPDPDLDRDIALLLEEPPGRRFTADLDAVEAWLRKRNRRGGWSVKYTPHIDAKVWSHAPTRQEAEFVIWHGAMAEASI